jgi:hypothetical protein
MNQSNTEYKEGDHQSFIQYLYSSEPKGIGTIQLESPPIEENKHIGLHTFEQLLMIFVDGLKFFYGDIHNKVNLNSLTLENITKIDQYFKSMNYEIKLEVFENIYEYQFKFPNYFKNQEHIKSETLLKDFYYEIFNSENKTFRISFVNI